MKKASFDFDSTLSRSDVQKLAKNLMNDGWDIWIVTTRMDDDTAFKNIGISSGYNDDLYKVAEELGISRSKIIFTCYEDKFPIIKENNFIFHIDDDSLEINLINKYTDAIGISCWKNNSWKEKILKICSKY